MPMEVDLDCPPRRSSDLLERLIDGIFNKDGDDGRKLDRSQPKEKENIFRKLFPKKQ